ncbi:MAG: MFS transporter [archaeon]|jgi:MFS family permease
MQKKKNLTRKNPKILSESKKTVWTFGIASLLNDFGANMIYPIWPLFLTTVLGANMSVLGLVDGLGDALVSLSQAASGYASDRLRKRKVFIWLGYLIGAISRIGYAISTSWPMIIPFRIIDRAGKIRDAPRDALVADHSTDKNRGHNFGLIKGLDKLGGVFGILLCIFLINYFGYTTFFMLAAIPSVISAALVYFIIKEKKNDKIKLYKGIKFKNLSNNYKLFLALSAVFALGSFSYSFLLVFASKTGYELTFIPILYLVYVVLAATFSLPFGKLADKIGRKKVMYIALLFWAITCIIFISSNAWWAILLTFVFYGLHHAALGPIQATFVSELAPKKFRASALGGYQMVIGLCALPASLIAGILWDTMGKTTPFILSLGLTIVAIIMLKFVKEKE